VKRIARRRVNARSRRIPSTGGQSLPGPAPTFGLFSDTLSTTSSLASWSPTFGTTSATQGTPGNRPSVVQDSVTGINCVRFDTGQSLSIAGALAFLSQGQATVLVVWRQRQFSTIGAELMLLDSSSNGGGATPGYQLRAGDKPVSSENRTVNARVWNGSTWVIDHNTAAGPQYSYAALKTNITTAQTSSARARMQVDTAIAYDDAFSVTLPAGAPGAAVLGNGAQVDIFAVLAWQGGITDTQLDAWNAYIANRFGVDVCQTLAGDSTINPDTRPPATNYWGFPSIAVMANGSYLYTLNGGQSEGGQSGLQIRTSASGAPGSWSPIRTLIAYDGINAIHDVVPTTLSNGDVLITYAIGVINCFFIRSTDNGATWSAPTRVDRGYDLLQFNSSKIIEEGGPLELRSHMYTQSTGDPHWDARVFVSHDGGATWPSDVLMANGNTDGLDYAENGAVKTTGNNRVALVRETTTGAAMYEYTSSDAEATWGGRANVIAANSAARMITTSTGDVLTILRPNAFLAATIFRRLGAGSWTDLGTNTAIPVSAWPVDMLYGDFAEKVPGTLDIAFGGLFGTYAANSFFRRWPIWQLKGQMPLLISGASSVAAGGTIQFSARGAGNFTWSVSTNNSGGNIDANGLYTAGLVFSNVTDVVQCTDLNGYAQTFSVAVSASTFRPWTLSSALRWWDTVNSAPGTSGGNLTSWADMVSGATLIPGSGSVPVVASNASFNSKPSITLGSSGSYMKTGASVTLSAHTAVFVFKTAAAGYLLVHVNDSGSDGGYWFTSSPAGDIVRGGSGQLVSSAAWPGNVQAGTALSVRCTFAGAGSGAKLSIGASALSVSASPDVSGVTTASGTVYIGGNQTGGGNLAADLVAVGLFDGTFSDSDWTNTHLYLKSLFGIP
jgi:hypothetical protein